MSYVAAFRTYRWDADIADMAVRFFAAFPSSGRKVVLADETAGSFETPYEKVSHTEQSCERLGLPAYPPGRALEFCRDYALYLLVDALPEYEYYIMAENGLAVNLSLEPVVADLARRGVDVVLHEVQPSTPDWAWHKNGGAAFAEPWRCLMFFIIASRRAAHVMLETRRAQALSFAAGDLREWPYCETFIPSALKSHPDLKIEEVGAFAETSHLRSRPRLSCRDPVSSAPGSMAHPVYGSKQFISLLLSDTPPREYFRQGSELRTSFDHEPFEDIVEPLGRALLRERDMAGLALLRQEIAARGLPPPGIPEDLALNKPALSSSVSEWSDIGDPALDACGANSDWLLDEYGFHTGHEHQPWWMVDLLDEFVVDRIEVLNRPTHSERFVNFKIDSSLDANAWASRYVKIDSMMISSLVGAPWRRTISEPFVARYVRIVGLETRVLHLRRIHVFGRAIRDGRVDVRTFEGDIDANS